MALHYYADPGHMLAGVYKCHMLTLYYLAFPAYYYCKASAFAVGVPQQKSNRIILRVATDPILIRLGFLSTSR